MSTPGLLVRPAAVAGSFYPDAPEALAAELQRCFDGAMPGEPGPASPAPKALVVPHAGYVYSGPVAATGYHRLREARARIRRVVLLGPSHRVALDGLAVSGADAFASPLGLVPVDAAARTEVLRVPGLRVDDAPHAREHSLEVQLPFLQAVLGEIEVLPVAVGRSRPEHVAAVLDAVWGGPETVVVISTDLSHYLTYADAKEVDRRTAGSIAALAPERIGATDACGAHPLRGFLHAAARKRLGAEVLDLRSSGDTAGGRDRVVGYGAFAFC